MAKGSTRKNETRTYWMICINGPYGEWCALRWIYADRQQAEKSLRWRRQWYPEAFLVQATMTQRESQNRDRPLPVRSRPFSRPNQDVEAGETFIETQHAGLRLVEKAASSLASSDAVSA